MIPFPFHFPLPLAAFSLRILGAATLTVAALSLGGCSALNAQNPPGSYKPVNATPDTPEARLMLKGADVTAYFTQGKYVQGSPQFQSSYEGVDFRFASAESKALFDQTPKKYLPEYGGYCANGIVYGIPWGGDADRFKMVNGKLYMFGGQGSLDGWNLDEPGNLKLADGYWQDEVQGNNSFVQRSKRLVFRVAHYKSGEELARLVAQSKANKVKP